ncbi:phosphate acetyltransferase [Xylanimonas allomyrinae]|uniref:Phosphate acetyltransferase n=1 Tax=Xylanimonas allomyrinae TaxID=2509459 RepID=A0A4P6EZ14_9MICO|nr:phosphate acetyltransferase [Xylanimonas allomyrinae]QAY63308.1 phosphate acetyltransferase [Xylanimonas allomyrinae]
MTSRDLTGPARRPVVTRSRVRDAVGRGVRELRLPAGAILTPDARDLARDHGVRLVVSDGAVPERGATTVPGAGFLDALYARAREADRTIVLPEGTEPRVCAAAASVREQRIARLVLLGPDDVVAATARAAGLDPGDVAIWDPQTSPHRAAFERRYLELRGSKGVTADLARAAMGDVSCFGTMMVAEGLADGMVSGAVHTTAETVRPALEIIRTADDAELVSSVFLMCLPGTRDVLVYADCAVNVNPTARQVAAIAVASARTARQLGIEPRVALLSYATHGSGSGPDVDLVREATALVRAAAPELPVDGPLQYDAAVDPGVGERKAPGSPVAGRATVLVFPDLSAGNIAYKAVQRSAGALAVGPVLQGLRKPVNDLSRGASVEDIVSTIAVTAVQAQVAAPAS